jgi:cytochrome c553
MRRIGVLLLALFPVLLGATPTRSQELPPAWAYPVNPPDFKLPPDDGTPRKVPGSSVTYTLTQARDRFLTPDWHPGDHPPMPEIVAQGRKPEVFACGFCHRAGGTGGPENANIAGLTVAYIVQQLADFKNGTRKSPVAKRGPTELKAQLVKTITDQEVLAAAEYFASLKPISIVTVVETDTVPKTYVTVEGAPGGALHVFQPATPEAMVEAVEGLIRDAEKQTDITYPPYPCWAEAATLAFQLAKSP